MDKQAMQVEKIGEDKVKDASIMTSKEKSMLTKRTIEEFRTSLSQMTTQEIRQKLKSPTHLMFIFGIERKLNS